MRNLTDAPYLSLWVTGCGTISADRTDSAKQQVAEATAAWVAAYNSRDPARITSMYDPEAVFWGTSAKRIAANPAAIAEYFKDAGNELRQQELLSENSIFGSMVMWQ